MGAGLRRGGAEHGRLHFITGGGGAMHLGALEPPVYEGTPPPGQLGLRFGGGGLIHALWLAPPPHPTRGSSGPISSRD